jgi:hypothetical protein
MSLLPYRIAHVVPAKYHQLNPQVDRCQCCFDRSSLGTSVSSMIINGLPLYGNNVANLSLTILNE